MKKLFLLPILLLSLISCSSEQRESVTSGACVIDSGSFPVGFNAYVVPEGNHPSYPPFCSPVPAGLLNIVIDLFSFELREQKIAIKVVKIEQNEEQEALSIPSTTYNNGSIPIMISLEPRSKYNILLLEGDPDKDIGSEPKLTPEEISMYKLVSTHQKYKHFNVHKIIYLNALKQAFNDIAPK